jgi:DNA polymerase III delta subunit
MEEKKLAIRLFYGEETYLLEARVKKIKKEFGEQIARN